MNRKSYVIAGLITLALIVWMGSGYLDGFGGDAVAERSPKVDKPETMMVQVRRQSSESVTRSLESQGQAEPDRRVSVLAETSGKVVEVLVDKGAKVEEGEPLVKLAMNDRIARLRETQALIEQREADYEAARKLGDRGYQSNAKLREAYAALQAARAARASMRQEIANTTIEAPFEGVVNDRLVDVGSYVSPGDPVAEIVDNQPLKIAVDIAQQNIQQVSEGAEAQIELATGGRLSGKVTYIAAAANPQTRTFRVEVESNNPDSLRAGISATVRIPLETIQAHFLSPALLGLDAEGQLGVKTVAADDRVRFNPVEVVRTERNGVWVSGLPDNARLITVGQGFVQGGEAVAVTRAPESELSLDQLRGPEAVPDEFDG